MLPLKQADQSMGPLAFLDLFERVALETVSRACRDEARAHAPWRRQLVVPAAYKDAPVVNEVFQWCFLDNNLSCASLTSLSVLCCRNLTNDSIKAVAAGCASLTSLDVACCSKLTDESIKAVAAGCPSLTSLNVANCSKLTDESFKAVAAQMTMAVADPSVTFGAQRR